jgi:hypothetical protein
LYFFHKLLVSFTRHDSPCGVVFLMELFAQ